MTNSNDNFLFNPHLPTLRAATIADVNALVQLEQICFHTDQISRRQWLYLITKAHSDIIIGQQQNEIVGYILLLYNSATTVARIYSIAVANNARRLGLGKQLVQAAEGRALEHGRNRIRLEIRLDNTASINLFETLNYKHFGYYKEYYEDKMDAHRLEKFLL